MRKITRLFIIVATMMIALVITGCGLLNDIVDPPQPPLPPSIPIEVRQNVGSFTVEIRYYRLLQQRVWTTDHELIMVTYEWTNNSGSTGSFDRAFNHSMFQDGIALDRFTTWVVDAIGETPPENSVHRDLLPGYSQVVWRIYTLRNANSTVTVQLETADGGRLTHAIDLGRSSNTGQAQPSLDERDTAVGGALSVSPTLDADPPLVGRWAGSEYYGTWIYTFNADGTASAEYDMEWGFFPFDGTWRVEAGMLITSWMDYWYFIDGNRLELHPNAEGDILVFTRLD